MSAVDDLLSQVLAAPEHRVRREDHRPLAYGWCPICRGEFYSVFEAWLDEDGGFQAESRLHCDGCES